MQFLKWDAELGLVQMEEEPLHGPRVARELPEWSRIVSESRAELTGQMVYVLRLPPMAGRPSMFEVWEDDYEDTVADGDAREEHQPWVRVRLVVAFATMIGTRRDPALQ